MGALNESMGRAGDGDMWLDLVALGTVADVAPLLNENRWLLKRGLERLARSERPGLRALMETSGIAPGSVTADAIGCGLAPRLNAAGRLKHARLALDLLLERDEEEARRRALELTALNRERQGETGGAGWPGGWRRSGTGRRWSTNAARRRAGRAAGASRSSTSRRRCGAARSCWSGSAATGRRPASRPATRCCPRSRRGWSGRRRRRWPGWSWCRRSTSTRRCRWAPCGAGRSARCR